MVRDRCCDLSELLDEVEFECDVPVAEEVAKMIEMAIQKAGEHLGLKIALAGEGKVGLNWKETH